MRRVFFFCVFILLVIQAFGQTTRVRGVVRSTSGQPIAYANVYFLNTTIGTLSDDRGTYNLETRDEVDSLTVSIVGYKEQTRKVIKNAYNAIDFELEAQTFAIDEVKIVPGANPAFPILDSLHRRRRLHDISMFKTYKCDIYSKLEFGFTNFTPRFRSNRMQKNFGFIFDYVDTAALTGRPYLPAIISETMTERYHRKFPPSDWEDMKANRVSGFDRTEHIAEYTGQMQTDFNFYDNFITFFNIRFASPLSESGRMYYKYFLVDSTRIDGRKTYKIRFHPRNTATAVLDGEINIDSASYALRYVRARMPKGVNVNWIKQLEFENENAPSDSLYWFRTKDAVTAEVSILKSDSSKLVSVLAKREVFYSNIHINKPLSRHEPQKYDETVFNKDDDYWLRTRPFKLSSREQKIYKMVDSVQNTPLYKNVYTVLNTILSGYYNTKYVGFGPYMKLMSFNNIEKVKLQMGVRTTKDFSKKVRLGAYVGYGFKDKAVKGGGQIEYVFNRALFRKMTISALHDLLQLGAADYRRNNFLSSILSNGGQRMSMVNKFQFQYEHEFVKGISTTLQTGYMKVRSNEYVQMQDPDGKWVDHLSNPYVSASFRFAKEEKLLREIFDVRQLGFRYPILTLGFSCGFPSLRDKNYKYFQIDFDLHCRPKLAPIGYSDITLQGGMLFGKVPYLLLNLPKANRSYVYNKYGLSGLNYYEFATDRWLTLYWEHHFNGAMLGLIPLIKKLQWREIFLCKCYWGDLTEKNDGTKNLDVPLMFPENMHVPRVPYLELGCGIENIFKIFRVDFIWRVTHRDVGPKSIFGKNFTINASVQLLF